MESIQQSDKPLTLCCSQNVTLSQNVANLVQLEQKRLAHDLQRTNFFGILFLSQEHLPIASLTNLGKDLKVTLPQTSASLAKIGALAAEVFREGFVVFGFGRLRRRRVLCLELVEAILAGVYVSEQVKIIVEKV